MRAEPFHAHCVVVMRSRVRGVMRLLLLLSLGAAIGAGAVSVVSSRLGDTADAAPPAPVTTVVRVVTLGRTIRQVASASWRVVGQVYAPSDGLVTALSTTGSWRAGDVVMRMAERPVILVPGAVPAFRDLTPGVRGRDVMALQDYLASLGYEVNGDRGLYTATTGAAVSAWQRATDQAVTGRIALGDILVVAMKSADAVVLRWREGIAAGARVIAGMPILDRLADAPTLEIDLRGSVPGQLGEGIAGVATFTDGTTRSVVVGPVQTLEGRTWADLLPADDGPMCLPERCPALVPPTGITSVDATFTLVPATTGPAVPVAAVQSAADESAFVVLADGQRVPVRVVVASDGLAIVEGVEAGQAVQIP